MGKDRIRKGFIIEIFLKRKMLWVLTISVVLRTGEHE